MTRAPSLVLAAVAAAFLAAPLSAALAGGFEKNVPANTVAFVGVDDVTAFKKAAAETAWGRMLADPGFDAIKERFAKEFTAIGDKTKEEVGASPLELVDMITGGAALALLDLKCTAPAPGADGAPVGGVETFPAFLCLLGVGDKGEEFLSRLDVMTDREVADGKTIRQSEQEGDVDVRVLLSAKDANRHPFVLRYGLKGDVFVATICSEELKERPYFAEALAALSGEGGESLADNAAFAKSSAARGENGIRLFGDLPKLLSTFLDIGESSGRLGEEEKKVIDSLGVRDLGAFAGSIRMSEAGTEVDAEVPFTGQGWIPRLAHAFFQPDEFKVHALAPEKPMSVTAWHLGIAPGIEAVRAMLGEMDPETAKSMDAALAENFKVGDVDLKSELIDNLTGEIGVFTVPLSEEELENAEGAMIPPNFVVAIGLKDGGRVTTAVDAILREQGMHAARKKEEFQGTTVFSVPIAMVATIRYAVLDDYLIVSLSDELLKDTLRRRASADLPNLAASDEFKAAVEKGGGGTASAMLYWDAQEFAKNALTGLKMVVAQPKRRGRTPDAAPIDNPFAGVETPDPALAEKYLKGMMIEITRIDDTGLRIHFNSP